jgi:effector-binding domain-containing protein
MSGSGQNTKGEKHMKKLFTVILLSLLLTALGLAQETEKKVVPEQKPAIPTTEKAMTAPMEMKHGSAKMIGEIAAKTIPAQTCATVFEKAADYAPKEGYKPGREGYTMAYVAMMEKGFGKLMEWIHTSNAVCVGPPFATYFEDPTKTKSPTELTCKIGFPVAADTKEAGAVKVQQMPEMLCAVVQYEGAYDEADDIWTAVDKWITANGYSQAGPPSEVYFKGPKETKNPAEYLTEIRQPVMKAEGKKEVIKEEKKIAK